MTRIITDLICDNPRYLCHQCSKKPQQMETEKKKTDLPDEDWYVFIPDEEMRAFEHTLNNLEQAREKFRKLKDEMVRVEI